jgi:predicted MarR family transcription regulator
MGKRELICRSQRLAYVGRMKIDRGIRVEDDFMTADEAAALVTRLELAVHRLQQSMDRWTSELHHMVGPRAMSANDVGVLHAVRMLSGDPDISALARFLNRFDNANIQYSLKKLEEFELLERIADKPSRKTRYRVTEAGRSVSDRFSHFRRHILVNELERDGALLADIPQIAENLDSLRTLLEQKTQLIVDRNVLPDDQVKI